MNLEMQIQIDPIRTLENQYKEKLEKGRDPYPTLTDFGVKTPLELLEHDPIIPIFLTVSKEVRLDDVTPFLKLRKPIANLPENEQKDLLRYITEIALDFIPQRVNGNNISIRRGTLINCKRVFQGDMASYLIDKLGLHFTESDIDACPKCGDKFCRPKNYPICSRCHQLILACDKGYINHYTGENTCDVCGENHALCVEHVRTPGEKTCTVYPRKRSNLQEFCDIVSVETRRLLQSLKIETRKILKEICSSFPTLVDFHTRYPETFLQQYPIIPAILTYRKIEKNPDMGLGINQNPKQMVSALRDITAAEWGDTLADISTAAFIKYYKLKSSLAEIDTCPRCGDPTCAGDSFLLCGYRMDVGGCGETFFTCEPRHSTILTCDNPLCTLPKKYRECTEHKCEIKDHTGLVRYLFQLENDNILTLNKKTVVKPNVERLNALTPPQQADFVKQFHTTVAQMDSIEKTAAVIQKTLRDQGLKISFEKPQME